MRWRRDGGEERGREVAQRSAGGVGWGSWGVPGWCSLIWLISVICPKSNTIHSVGCLPFAPAPPALPLPALSDLLAPAPGCRALNIN